MNQYESYIAGFSEIDNPLIVEMEKYAAEHHIPIMDRSGMDTFIGLLRIQQPKQILEIGSAIGYSAIRMVEALRETTIVTIERDVARFTAAVEYIGRSGFEDRIKIIEGDALLLDNDSLPCTEYDAIFIDAAKGQYKRFFEKYSKLLSPDGVIYCDNMFMHGAVLLEDTDIPKRNRTMIRNLMEFTGWIMNNPGYDTSLLPVGDGILIAVKRSS